MDLFVIFTSLLSIAFYILIFIALRKFVLWYWKVNRLVEGVENIYQLELLLRADEIREKQITIINKDTQKETSLSIQDYLKKDHKQNYKIK